MHSPGSDQKAPEFMCSRIKYRRDHFSKERKEGKKEGGTGREGRERKKEREKEFLSTPSLSFLELEKTSVQCDGLT